MALELQRKHPLRYYLALPLLRSLAMWFTPRTEILNLEGRLLPLSQSWENDPADFLVTLFLFIVNIAYVALALLGTARILQKSQSFENAEFSGCFTLLAIIAIRTIFLAFFAFPEPRYVLETFPDVIVLGAFASVRKHAI